MNAFRGWGRIKYVPGWRYPYEATALLARTHVFNVGGTVLNQVPLTDVMIRERVVLAARRVAPLGPGHSRRKGVDVGSD